MCWNGLSLPVKGSCRQALLTITNLYAMQLGADTPAIVIALPCQWMTLVQKESGSRRFKNTWDSHTAYSFHAWPCLCFCHLLLSQLLTPPSRRPAPFSHASLLFCQQQTGFSLKISLITLLYFYIWPLASVYEVWVTREVSGQNGQLSSSSEATAF